jgi:hypothetical protein
VHLLATFITAILFSLEMLLPLSESLPMRAFALFV